MQAHRLDDKLFVGGCPAGAADIGKIAEAGFAGILNNRPDGEAPDQPPAEEARAAARARGLAYEFLPVSLADLDAQTVARFRAALDRLPGPLFAHCATGRRASLLWVLARAAEGEDVEALMARTAAAGYDLTPQRPVIDRVLAEKG